MPSFTKLFAELFRDYSTDGVASSGAHQPMKSDIRAWGLTVEGAFDYFSALTADRTGNNDSVAQAVFGTSEDAFTVAALTSYRFKAMIAISRAAGTTSHTTGFLFGGTATFTSIDALARVSNPTGNALGAVSEIQISAATETVLTAANISATENVRMTIEGIMRINGAGTIIPQFKFSAAPGGAPTIKRNSFLELHKIGSNTVASLGAWA